MPPPQPPGVQGAGVLTYLHLALGSEGAALNLNTQEKAERGG